MRRPQYRWMLIAVFAATSAWSCGQNNDDDENLAPDVGDVADVEDDTDVVAPRCGDGQVDDGEACDGDALAGATCTSLGFEGGSLACADDCTFDTAGCDEAVEAFCGDGLIGPEEDCDGDALGGETCVTLGYIFGELACGAGCTFDESGCLSLTRCGDGVLAAAEECDDGNTDDDDGCSYDCQIEDCGDGIKQSDEECDTAGAILLTCEDIEGRPQGIVQCVDCQLEELVCPTPTDCGNGVVDFGEACDDGNDDPGDGCDACVSTTCGDGILDPYELCDGGPVELVTCEDLGFATGVIGCTEACTITLDDCHNPRCGDGLVEADEACDDGNTDNDDGCSSRCVVETCGDGVLQAALGELCDGEAGDLGCADLGYSRGPLGCDEGCAFDTSACVASATCGDGVVDADEACDEGDANGPEGACSESCTINQCFDVECPEDDLCTAYTCDPNVGCVARPLEGSEERCDGIDNDCDGEIDEGVLLSFYPDADADGYGVDDVPTEACEAPEGFVDNNDDCDDSDPAMFPGNPEVCDGLDNDCDGRWDDGVLLSFYPDADGDGHGVDDAPTEACEAPDGYVATHDDCDDSDPAMFPGNPELCDGIDNDCDGEIDEDFSLGGACSDGVGTCAAEGVMVCSADGTGTMCSAMAGSPSTDICDGLDNDCDGEVDEDFSLGEACSEGAGACAELGVIVCDGAGAAVCSAVPGDPTPEICDGVDNDCDGEVDTLFGEPLTQPCYDGPAGTQDVGVCMGGVQVCESAHFGACGGQVLPTSEVCDSVDNDCNGAVDDGVGSTYYLDVDGDGWGRAGETATFCTPETGFAMRPGDCDDDDANNFPTNTEVCDYADNNCDGSVDEGVGTTYYMDSDGDSYGNSDVFEQLCGPEPGWVLNNRDCLDSDPAFNPDVDDICDGMDNDCDGSVDEDPEFEFYIDNDEDGFGIGPPIPACLAEGRALVGGDCNDDNPAVSPGNTEVCDDGIDNTCDLAMDCDDDACAEDPVCVGGGAIPIAVQGSSVIVGPPATQVGTWTRLEEGCFLEQTETFEYQAFDIINMTGADQLLLVTADWGSTADGYLFAYFSPFVPEMTSGCIMADDDAPSTSTSQLVALSIAAGQMLTLVASTYGPGEPIGDYTIDVYTVPPGGCGDGTCDLGESPATCFADCQTSPGYCGDGFCDATAEEDVIVCPEDCSEPTDGCGDGFCDDTGGEGPTNCSADCGGYCGNGYCEVGEDPATCAADCVATGCGNGTCDGTEDVWSCPSDCWECGNFDCSPDESFMTCGDDCSTCGDGFCSIAELELGSCSIDCP